MSSKQRANASNSASNSASASTSQSGVFARPTPPSGYLVTVSHVQITPLLEACFQRQLERTASGDAFEAITSADLGLSAVTVTLSAEGICYPTGE